MSKIQINLLVFLSVMLFTVGCKSVPIDMSKSADNKSTGTIIVEMTGFRSNDGSALVGLYNNADGFPGTPEKNSIIISMKGAITNNKSIIEFKDVPYGTYAISLFHDENNNKTYDLGMHGIPKEGWAHSNNAKSQFGPPEFDDAKFELKSGEVKQVLNIIYIQN